MGETAQVPAGSCVASVDAAIPVAREESRHAGIVRVTHWIVTLCFFALLLTGTEILISHPRFYWGETGNDLTKPLFRIPIPASRDLVPTGYNYTLPDQNGWSRALHFQTAWLLVFTGLLYGIYGLFSGHFRKNLLPEKGEMAPRSLWGAIAEHLRFKRPSEAEAWSYNVPQRLAYLAVIFVLFPMIIWTGLAMSPTFTAAFPGTVVWLGGRQTARTIHFLVTIALVLFLLVHIVMIFLAGFWSRTRAMITGRAGARGRSMEGA